MVGVEGFEPPTFWTQTRRASQATLHPEHIKDNKNQNFINQVFSKKINLDFRKIHK